MSYSFHHTNNRYRIKRGNQFVVDVPRDLVRNGVTVENPLTGNQIQIGKRAFVKLIKSGRTVDENGKFQPVLTLRRQAPQLVLKKRKKQVDLRYKNFDVYYVLTNFQVIGRNGLPDDRQMAYSIQVPHGHDVSRYYQKVFDHLVKRFTIAYNAEIVGNITADNVADVQLLSVADQMFLDIYMYATTREPLKYRITKDLKLPNDLVSANNTSWCVIHNLWDELRGKEKFKRFTLQKLIDELTAIKPNLELCPRDLFDWVKARPTDYISLYCLDPCMTIVEKHIAKYAYVSIAFISNNAHMEVINDLSVLKKIQNSVKSIDDSEEIYASTETDRLTFIDQSDHAQLNKLVDGKIDPDIRVICTNADLVDLSTAITNHHGMISTGIRENSGKLTHYTHPVTNQVIHRNDDYHLVKELHEIAQMYYPKFKKALAFRNQTYNQLGNQLFEIMTKTRLPKKSGHTIEDLKITNDNHTKPFNVCLSGSRDFDHDQAVDIVKCYSNAGEKMQFDYPVFAITDTWKRMENDTKLLCGEYLLTESIQLDHIAVDGGQPLVLEADNILSWNLVTKLLEHGFLKREHIGWYRHASYTLDASLMREFVSKCKIVYGNMYKHVVNHFIGGLGKRHLNKDKAFMTSDFKQVNSVVCNNIDKTDVDVSVIKAPCDIYYVQKRSKVPLRETHASIFRQIVSQGKWDVLELILEMRRNHGARVKYIRTDCVGFYCKQKLDLSPYDNKYRLDTWHSPKCGPADPITLDLKLLRCGWDEVLPDYAKHEERGKPVAYYIDAKPVTDELGMIYEKRLKDSTFCCTGGPGLGKTVLANQMSRDGKATQRITSTHKAGDSLDENKREAVNKTYTLQSRFSEFRKMPRCDHLIWDEAFYASEKFLRNMYWLKQDRPDTVIQSFGDPNQCPQVAEKHFNYMESPVFQVICDRRIMKKKYIKGVSRYDWALYQALEYLLKHGRLPDALKKQSLNWDLDVNVTKFNQLRKGCISVTSINTKKMTGMKFEDHKGMTVVCNMNYKSTVFNSVQYVVTEVLVKNNVQHYRLKSMKGDAIKGIFPVCKFSPCFALTVYRYQGSTIRQAGNIHNVDQMCLNEIYTALSRFTCLDDIHLCWTDRVFKPYVSNQQVKLLMKQLERGEIYEMHTADKSKYYIGETQQSVRKRILDHITNPQDVCNTETGQWRYKHVSSVLFYPDPIAPKHELMENETYYIQYYREVLGLNVLNTKQLSQTKTIKFREVSVAPVVVDASMTYRHAYKVCERGDGSDVIIRYNGKQLKRFRVTKKRTLADAREEAEKFITNEINRLQVGK